MKKPSNRAARAHIMRRSGTLSLLDGACERYYREKRMEVYEKANMARVRLKNELRAYLRLVLPDPKPRAKKARKK